VFQAINTALVSIKDLIQKHKRNKSNNPKLLKGSVSCASLTATYYNVDVIIHSLTILN